MLSMSDEQGCGGRSAEVLQLIYSLIRWVAHRFPISAVSNESARKLWLHRLHKRPGLGDGLASLRRCL